MHTTTEWHELTDVVRAATGRPDAVPSPWWTEPVDYPVGSWGTGELARVRGRVTTANEPVDWSVFVKTLRSPLRMLDALPQSLRARAAADLTWRHEADIYLAALDDVLPAGMRMPDRYRIDEPGDGRIVEWLEDVAVLDVPWDGPRFARAAELLGRLAARLTRADRMPPSVSRVPGEVLRLQLLEREALWLPALGVDPVWTRIGHLDPGLQADLHRLAERLPALVDALEDLPQTYVHGDASPQNLLVPASDPEAFVAIDWSLSGLLAVGYDLSQLVVGLAHAGRLDPAEVPAVCDVVVPAYRAGLAAEGITVDADVVRFGCHAALAVRSALTALPLDGSADDDALAHRTRLTRYLVDLGLALPLAGP
jgi:hypothetical protein